MKKAYIYSLYDPREPDRYRYVGQTIRTLATRLKGHISQARSPKSPNNKRNNWIKKLLRENVTPQMHVIEEIIDYTQDFVNEREIFWISYYRSKGQADKNTENGGQHGERFYTEAELSVLSKKQSKAAEKAAREKGLLSASDKKEILLAMPKNSKKPKYLSKMHNALYGYTTVSSASYDRNFDQSIREKQPHWFISPSTLFEQRKQHLLGLPIGSDKPQKGTDLYSTYKSAMSSKNKSYDPEFREAILEKQPHWFDPIKQKAESNKEYFLNLPPNSEKPLQKDRLGRLYINYICEKSQSYDEDFVNKMKQKQPHWFVTVFTEAEKKKKDLLAFPIGFKKPKYGSKTYESLSSFTGNGSSYDSEFDKVIRERQPHWFIKRTEKGWKQKMEEAMDKIKFAREHHGPDLNT